MNISKPNFDFVILSTYQQLYVFQNFPSNVMVCNVGYFTSTLKVECKIKMPNGCSVTDNDRMHHHRILFAISEDSVILLLWWGILLFVLCWRLNFGSAEYWCVEYFNTLNKTSTIFVERTELQFQLMISAGLPCCIHIACWFTCCVLKNDLTFLILQMEGTESWRFGLVWNMKYTALPSYKLVRCRNLLTILSKMWL